MKSSQIRIGQFYFDTLLLVVCTSLLMIGYVMVVSASLHLGVKIADDSMYYPARQLLHIGLGLLLGSGVALVPMRFWEQYGPTLFLIGLCFLVAVLIPGLGIEVNGSKRWLSIAGFRIQVSEVVKFFSVIYMAGYVTRHEDSVKDSAYGLLKPLGLFFCSKCFAAYGTGFWIVGSHFDDRNGHHVSCWRQAISIHHITGCSGLNGDDVGVLFSLSLVARSEFF